MSNMENWKLTLAWGCLTIFFAFPIAIPILQFASGRSASFRTEFGYMAEYMRTVAAIIISLAGFNTVEIFRGKGGAVAPARQEMAQEETSRRYPRASA